MLRQRPLVVLEIAEKFAEWRARRKIEVRHLANIRFSIFSVVAILTTAVFTFATRSPKPGWAPSGATVIGGVVSATLAAPAGITARLPVPS